MPDFRLNISGNLVPLSTQFEVLTDGTNGNTVLRRVVANLGMTTFTTSGEILKTEELEHRPISLDVFMPNGNIQDLLRLALKGEPFMSGQIALKTNIEIPPLSGTVGEKLRIAGHFQVIGGKLLG